MSDVDPAEFAKAQRLFRRFQGHYRKPGKTDLILIDALAKPVVALEVGTATAIGYKALGNGKYYDHEFEGHLPKIYVNADGDQIFFLGGEYRFTDRGFIK
jgi:hypothetical protein